MRKINVLFEYDYEDVDIVSVPDYIAENIESVLFDFFKWLKEPKNQQRFHVQYDGKTVLSIDTNALIWWINRYDCAVDEPAFIVETHTRFCPDYPVADL